MRKIFSIDSINPNTINLIETKNFNLVYMIYPDNASKENDKCEITNILRDFIQVEKEDFKNNELSVRDLMIKVFLTIESTYL